MKIEDLDINDPYFFQKQWYNLDSLHENGEEYQKFYVDHFAKEYPYLPQKETFTLAEVSYLLFKTNESLDMSGYYMPQNWDPSTLPEITEDEKKILQPYALMLACLQGNAFPDLIDQYMKDAKYFLMQNGWWDKLQNKE